MASKAASNQNILPLLSALRGKLLPWVEERGLQHALIVGRDKGSVEDFRHKVPTAARVARRRGIGTLSRTRGARTYANQSQFTGAWPEYGLAARRGAVLTVVLSGDADLGTSDFTIKAKEGDLLFILPDTPFSDGTKPHLDGSGPGQRQCQLLWMAYGGAGLGCWICHSAGDRHFELPGESCYVRNPEVGAVYHLLMQEAAGERDDRILVCQHLLLALLTMLCREMHDGLYFQFPHQRPESEAIFDRQDPIHTAQEYVRAHLDQHLTIDSVARHVYLSRTQFTKSFRQKTSKSFVDFLTECRMEEAKSLLSQSEWSVIVISRMVGLKPSRLRTLFQEHLGMSPSEYRQSQMDSPT